MKDLLRERLDQLRAELELGRKAQADLEARREELTRTMLRIGGAIQVLQELLAASPEGAAEPIDHGATESAAAPVRRMTVR